MSPIRPEKLDFEYDIAWAINFPMKTSEVLAEMVFEVNLDFLDPQNRDPPPKQPDSSLLAIMWKDDYVECGKPPLQTTNLARCSTYFPISDKDVEKVARLLHQQVDYEKIPLENPFVFESTNLHGDFAKELQALDAPLEIKSLLSKYSEVFGPLPPPRKGCKLVEMDLELNPEWATHPLRGKCWPMSELDCKEIESQVDELVQSGLVEPFAPGTFPKYCTPTFLVDKKESATRRMVGQYSKLNARTKSHAGYLPNMESLIEGMARCRFKTKLDLRSGGWQIGMTGIANELSAFFHPLRPLFQLVVYALRATRGTGGFSRNDRGFVCKGQTN